MAHRAEIPIVVGFMDFKKKVLGIKGVIYDIENTNSVMQQINDFKLSLNHFYSCFHIYAHGSRFLDCNFNGHRVILARGYSKYVELIELVPVIQHTIGFKFKLAHFNSFFGRLAQGTMASRCAFRWT